MTFEQMNLDKNIIQALHTLGYEKPLPVQEKVIPNILSPSLEVCTMNV